MKVKINNTAKKPRFFYELLKIWIIQKINNVSENDHFFYELLKRKILEC